MREAAEKAIVYRLLLLAVTARVGVDLLSHVLCEGHIDRVDVGECE